MEGYRRWCSHPVFRIGGVGIARPVVAIPVSAFLMVIAFSGPLMAQDGTSSPEPATGAVVEPATGAVEVPTTGAVEVLSLPVTRGSGVPARTKSFRQAEGNFESPALDLSSGAGKIKVGLDDDKTAKIATAPADPPVLTEQAVSSESEKPKPRAIFSRTKKDAEAADRAVAEMQTVQPAANGSGGAIVGPEATAIVEPAGAPKKKRRGLLARFFSFGKNKKKDDPVAEPAPEGRQEIPMESLSISEKTGERVAVGDNSGAAQATVVPSSGPPHPERTLIELETQNDGMSRFPLLEMPHTKSARTETQIERIIDAVTSLYTERADGIDDLEMGLDFASLPEVPKGFDASWSDAIGRQIWSKQPPVSRGLFGVYSSALENSHQVRAFSEIPLIRETSIQEARGQFDIISFIDGRTSRIDDPTSSELTTGEIGGRFLEDRTEADFGVRKQFKTGTEVALSNRLSTLSNNSEFTSPNPQTSSEIVVAVTQPLLAGSGYHYNTARLKVAKLDSKLAAAEYLRQLESYLVEVNRTYWGVYLARAGYLQKRNLVDRTEAIVGRLQAREGVDESANLSELLRARSSLAQRRASLIRSAMAIRTAEERLRAMVNDPAFALGANSEFIPSTSPILSGPKENIREVALDAITNRSEVLQNVYQVKAAGLMRDQQQRDLLPTLNLILEASASGLDANRDLGGAYEDLGDNDLGWLAGLQFQVPWERNFAKARVSRRNHELRQQQHQLRATIDNVLLESIVAYQELRTSYRDMQGKYQAVLATREEMEQLEERLDVDTDDQRTVGYQLQLILDSIERNETSEEQFLLSVVMYNVSFIMLDRARGTLLRQHGVEIRRHNDGEMDVIEAQLGSRPVDGGGKSGPAGAK